jgi:hypothetical protein
LSVQCISLPMQAESNMCKLVNIYELKTTWQ